MMKNVRKITGHTLLVTALLVGGLALAAGAKQPVGKVSIEEKQFGLILGGSTGVNVPNLRMGKLDAAFISGEGDDPLLSSQVLCEEELVIAAPAGLRDQLTACDVPALAALPWVYTSPDCAHYGVMRTVFEAHCCAPEKVVLANQEDALRGMVEAGVGLGIVRRDDMREAVAAGRVFIVPRQLPTVSLRFAWLTKRANDPVLRAVIEAVSTVWQLAPEAAREAG